jgi:hypothetical protein
MKLQLVIRYVGFGNRCNGCGRVRETTRYTLRQGENTLKEFLLCDACQDKGYVIEFTAIPPSSAVARKERRKRIKISRKLETGVAYDIGGRTQPGSGNQDAKADIRKVDEWRLEHKYTDSVKGFRVEVQALDAVIRHGNMSGEWPGLVVNFRRLRRSFVMIPYELFLEIVERVRDTIGKHRRSG